jgi:hypothetical protein
MEYNVSAKRNGKWWNFGKIKTNQYGNQQLSFKKTQEFIDFIASSGDWVSFSLFEAEDKTGRGAVKQKPVAPASSFHDDLSDSIPF